MVTQDSSVRYIPFHERLCKLEYRRLGIRSRVPVDLVARKNGEVGLLLVQDFGDEVESSGVCLASCY